MLNWLQLKDGNSTQYDIPKDTANTSSNERFYKRDTEEDDAIIYVYGILIKSKKDAYVDIVVKYKKDNDLSTSALSNRVEIDKVQKEKDGETDKTKWPKVNNTTNDKTSDRDYFVVKAYYVSADKYISNIEHGSTDDKLKNVDNTKYYPENVAGYGLSRKYLAMETKKNNPVYVDNGENITFRICLRNTSSKVTDYQTDVEKRADNPHMLCRRQ